MERGFQIHKYSQVFDRVSASYISLMEFVNVNKCITFPSESNDYSLVNLNFIKLRVPYPRIDQDCSTVKSSYLTA
jgi:hypothetical protein